MATCSTICLNLSPAVSVSPAQPCNSQLPPTAHGASKERKQREVTVFAAKSGGFPLNSNFDAIENQMASRPYKLYPDGKIFKKCETCGGKRSIECPGCKGTGKNKKNGNIFERWKCFDCQGFGLKSCPKCGQGGLTPEQRGER